MISLTCRYHLCESDVKQDQQQQQVLLSYWIFNLFPINVSPYLPKIVPYESWHENTGAVVLIFLIYLLRSDLPLKIDLTQIKYASCKSVIVFLITFGQTGTWNLHFNATTCRFLYKQRQLNGSFWFLAEWKSANSQNLCEVSKLWELTLNIFGEFYKMCSECCIWWDHKGHEPTPWNS